MARTEYGEGQLNALNLRTRIFRHCDSTGIVTHLGLNPLTQQSEAYDFKGNLLRSTRQLVSDYKSVADWTQSPALDAEIFVSATAYDALNRVSAATNLL